jgi:hypothetical protein
MNRFDCLTMKRRFLLTAILTCLSAAAFLASGPAVQADPDAKAKAEIDHLLKFITDSKATFIRNGDPHKAAEAVEHIKAKRDHYIKKISSAEDFVKLAATKSALSGKNYQVKLADGTTRENAAWLLEELKRHRKAKAAAEAKASPSAGKEE